MTPRVLVTNVEERAALATCRALEAAGYTVVGAASATPAAGLWSRACAERLRLPDPRHDESGFALELEAAVAARGVDVVIPSVDAAIVALLGSVERLERHASLGLPSREVVLRSLDKLELSRAAAKVGLPPPESVACDALEQATEAARALGFPLLVKPRTTVVGAFGRRRQQATVVVAGEGELVAALAAAGTPALLQRYEDGATVFSCGGVMSGGRLLGLSFSRYLRTWRPSAGSAAYSETVEPPPGLEEQVLALVEELGWQGIFELELVGRDGDLHAIDFNPRPYGSMALATSAGVNLPALWCDALLGRDPAPSRSRPGFRYRFEEADLRHLAWQLAHGRVRAALAVLVPRRRTTHAFFRMTDPLPALAEALRLPRRLVSRTAHSIATPSRARGTEVRDPTLESTGTL